MCSVKCAIAVCDCVQLSADMCIQKNINTACFYSRFTDGSEKLSDNSPGAASTTSFESAEFAQEFSGLSHEEQERLRAEWNQELSRVEEEITTLRTVLASKMRLAAELKRKLGITVWKEISEDMNQGLRNVKESTVYVFVCLIC